MGAQIPALDPDLETTPRWADIGLLARASVLLTEPAHYDTAATLYRRCRGEGETVRRLIDCLIAAVAIGADVPVLHRDADFDVLARHTELDIVR